MRKALISEVDSVTAILLQLTGALFVAVGYGLAVGDGRLLMLAFFFAGVVVVLSGRELGLRNRRRELLAGARTLEPRDFDDFRRIVKDEKAGATFEPHGQRAVLDLIDEAEALAGRVEELEAREKAREFEETRRLAKELEASR